VLAHQCLSEASSLVHIGSGSGHLLVQAAVKVGCSVYGLETEHSMHAEAVELAHSMRVLCEQLPLRMGGVTLENSVVSKATLLAQWVSRADVIIVQGISYN
ncbi:hypothetical protein K525DRAFT_162436, partial [Schizophyllum commune Loenen D]